MLKKLKLNKGIFLSLVTYPILILAVGYSAVAFVSAINGNNLAKITFSSTQAQYNAYKGIEYASLEIINQGVVPFVTHLADNDDVLQANTDINLNLLTPRFGGTMDLTSKVYHVSNSTGGSADVKIYLKNSQVFILSRGTTSVGKSRLFLHKISGSSLYDYFFFFPKIAGRDAVNLGWQTLDAQGAKIHANNAIAFSEGVRIYNANEVSSDGAMYYGYSRHLYPLTEGTYAGNRFPWWTPSDYQYATPPIPPDNNSDGVPDNNVGNYVNNPDGHNNGDRYGLIVYDTGTSQYRSWKDATHQGAAETMKPIYPWPYDGTIDWSTQTAWDPLSADRYQRYKQQNKNCGIGANPGCASGTVNNENYSSSLTNINNTWIPNDLMNNASSKYQNYRYYGRNEQMDMRLTNSDNPSAASAWDNFINAYSKTVTSPTEITGLAGVVKAGPSRGGQYIAPPKLVMSELINQAKDQGKGIVIEPEPTGGIRVDINGGSASGGYSYVFTQEPTLASSQAWICSGDPGKQVMSTKAFINGETGQQDKVVQISIKNLRECFPQYLPTGGLIYSNYGSGLVLKDAEQLPDDGLTTIVNGNLYLQGFYNHVPVADPSGTEWETWTWQPSAAIMSNNTYLLSSTYNYPTTLPVTYRHAEYPYSGTYTCAANGPGCNAGTYTIPPGTGSVTRDFISGYNWYATNHTLMEHKVDGGFIYNGTYSYIYDVSLVGRYGYQPRYLELWQYYSNPGNATTQASGGVYYRPVVIGAAVQLSNEFDGTAPFYSVSSRPCSSPPPGGYPAGYACRNNPGGTWDLIASNSSSYREYQTRYLSSPVRPPGPGIGYAKAILVELTNNNTNWTRHIARITPPGDIIISP